MEEDIFVALMETIKTNIDTVYGDYQSVMIPAPNVFGSDFSFGIMQNSVAKYELIIRARVLNFLINTLHQGDKDGKFTSYEDIKKTINEYHVTTQTDIFNEFYETYRISFETLWSLITINLGIVDKDNEKYHQAKVEALIIAHTLMSLFPNDVATNYEDYTLFSVIKSDNISYHCSHKLIEDLNKIFLSIASYPLNLHWESSDLPFDMYLSYKNIETGKTIPSLSSRWQIPDFTLSDFHNIKNTGFLINRNIMFHRTLSSWIDWKLSATLNHLYQNHIALLSLVDIKVHIIKNQDQTELEKNEQLNQDLFNKFSSLFVNHNLNILSNSEVKQNISEDPKLLPWEKIALENELVAIHSDNPRIYKIAVRSVKNFLNGLKSAIREKYNIPESDKKAQTLMTKYMPTYDTLDRMVYSKDGKQYAKRTFEKTASLPTNQGIEKYKDDDYDNY